MIKQLMGNLFDSRTEVSIQVLNPLHPFSASASITLLQQRVLSSPHLTDLQLTRRIEAFIAFKHPLLVKRINAGRGQALCSAGYWMVYHEGCESCRESRLAQSQLIDLQEQGEKEGLYFALKQNRMGISSTKEFKYVLLFSDVDFKAYSRPPLKVKKVGHAPLPSIQTFGTKTTRVFDTALSMNDYHKECPRFNKIEPIPTATTRPNQLESISQRPDLHAIAESPFSHKTHSYHEGIHQPLTSQWRSSTGVTGPTLSRLATQTTHYLPHIPIPQKPITPMVEPAQQHSQEPNWQWKESSPGNIARPSSQAPSQQESQGRGEYEGVGVGMQEQLQRRIREIIKKSQDAINHNRSN